MSTQNKNIFSPMTFLQVWDTMVRVYLKWEKIIKTKEEENMENKEKEVREIVAKVYEALKIKGYDPISQIVGYILSGDPTYITSYNGARGLIVKIERDELLEEFAKTYIKTL